MLTFEEKLQIMESFPELEKKEVSMGRVNFHYNDTVTDKKNVVYHLHPNGNGFVYAERIGGYDTDSKGMVNIRNFTEEELHQIVRASIASLSTSEEEDDPFYEEWVNHDDQLLVLMEEDDAWNIYAGIDLDGTFNSYPEAANYLNQEGFKRA